MIYSAIKLLLSSVIAVNALKPNCNMTEVMADECGRKTVLIGNRDFKKPKDDAELSTVCQNIDDGLKCLKRYSKTCLDAFSSQAIKIIVKNGISMIDRICKDPDGRSELFHHLSCFESDDHMSGVHLCMDKYIVQMEHLANITGDHRIPATCCAFHNLKDCTKQRVSEMCENNKTADYLGSQITDLTSELINFACGQYKSISDCNRLMDKKEWQFLLDLVASDDPKVIQSQKVFTSPFIVLTEVLKTLRN